MSSKVPQPPKWADRFLSWYCNPKLLEQIQGDVHELFYWRLEEEGVRKAKRSFAWDTIRLFRWSNIKRKLSQTQKNNNMGMFKNYFKIGVRNLWKQRMPSTINVLGLSIAVACAIVAFKWIESTYVKDNFHENLNDVFLVTHWEDLKSNKVRNGQTDHILSREILKTVPGISKSTRYSRYTVGTRINGRESSTSSYFVDTEYLKMFSFDMIEGNVNALSSLDQIVINKSTAERYFGQKDALNEQIELKIGDEWRVFTIGAILKAKPRNSSLENYFLVNYTHLDQVLNKKEQTWNTNFFIQRESAVPSKELSTAMDGLLPVFNKGNENNPYTHFELEPLRTMAIKASEIKEGVGSSPPMAPNLLLGSIALFMIILATFNYINISLAMVMKRFKEIGIRKVIGGKRGQLISQFLIENLLLCTFSLLLGILIAGAFLLPSFNKIAGESIPLDILHHENLLVFLTTLLVTITFSSGIYPAIIASSYRPVTIMGRASEKTSNRRLSAIFLTFQMILAMITIVAAAVFVHTGRVNESRDWGYDQYNKLSINIPDSTFTEVFREKIDADPSILNVAGTQTKIGRDLNGFEFKHGDVKAYAEFFRVGADYPQVLKMELLEGRYFDRSLESDLDRKLIVNEAFLEALDLRFDPGQTRITQDSTEYSIIGVVKDFHYWSLDRKIRGVAMKAIPPKDYTSFMVEMQEGNIHEQRKQLLVGLSILAPDSGIGVYLQETINDSYFESTKGLRNVMLFTATVAVLLAAMGLYGLVNINVSSQIKSFGIRKVLGASGIELANVVLKRFRWVLLFAILIGASVAVLLIGGVLDLVYAYHPNIGIGPITVAILILVSVVFLTINIQIQKVRKLNPADTLRYE